MYLVLATTIVITDWRNIASSSAALKDIDVDRTVDAGQSVRIKILILRNRWYELVTIALLCCLAVVRNVRANC